jgi:hypothetical protein
MKNEIAKLKGLHSKCKMKDIAKDIKSQINSLVKLPSDYFEALAQEWKERYDGKCQEIERLQ